jgi:hypothetical protein
MNPTAADRGAVEQRLATLQNEIAERERLERDKQQAAERARRERAAERAERARNKNTEPLVPRRGPSPAPWIMAGVGAIGLGVGIYFGVRARDQEEAGNDPALSQQEALVFASDAEDSALVANVLYATAGSVLLAGVIWGAVDLWMSSSP